MLTEKSSADWKSAPLLVLILLSMLGFLLWAGPVCHAAIAIDTSLINFHYHGQDTASKIGSFLTPLGDVNNDGYDDIAISSKSPAGTFLFLGSAENDGIPDKFWDGYYGSVNPIDLDGDGINDLIIRRPGGSLHFFKGLGDSLGTIPFDSLFSDTAGDYFQFFNRTAYIDNDSYGDLVVFEDGPRRVIHFYSDPALDKTPDWSYELPLLWSLSGLILVDYNGDGNLDICAGLNGRSDTSGYIAVFYGPQFGAAPDQIIAPPSDQYSIWLRLFPYQLSNIGDFNGDGWDDMGVIYTGASGGYSCLIYLCGPYADTLPDRRLSAPGRHVSSVGDINGDGYDDIACGGSAVWEGMLFIYLGGPNADPNYDETVSSDDLPPLFLYDIGYQIAPAGDFNGDGIDDFMFSCTNFLVYDKPGDVFVVAGSENYIADADDSPQFQLPDDIELKQNYPNPFNPSTTIEFSLPRREYAELRIYNIVGELVAVLLGQSLPAGEHEVTWDGLDSHGHRVASGVYYYEISATTGSSSKRMMLLK